MRRVLVRGSMMDKVDRALEMQVIDWLQWSEFPESLIKNPDDSDMAQLALELIQKRKLSYKNLQSKFNEAINILELVNKQISHDGRIPIDECPACRIETTVNKFLIEINTKS